MRRTSRYWQAALSLSLFSLSFALAPAGFAGAKEINPYQLLSQDKATGLKEYKLKTNGLQILLAEKHDTPVATVMLVYRVGSRNEAVGYTGSTHFLEHMMFKGTKAHDPALGTGIDDLLKPIGGLNNATTYYDRTYYYEVVPASGLKTCLELEADRMRNALLRESDRQSEMTVVRNELERNENYAATVLDTQVFATAFREHPYHHPVIGWRSDVEGVPTARLRQFYKDFYYPDNATLIVIGDFKTKETLANIADFFGKVPKSAKPFPTVYTVEPKQEGERRFVVQRGEELPKIMFAYHVPKAVDKNSYPLTVLASILGDHSRQSSRLYKNLVEPGLASQAAACHYMLRDPGLFTLYASANEGVTLAKIEEKVKAELKKLALNPVSDLELERAKKAVWKKMKLQAADPVGMAEELAESIAVADWHWWLNFEKNIKAVSKADIQRVAELYFSDSNCTVGNYLPNRKTKEAESAASGDLQSLISELEPNLLAISRTQPAIAKTKPLPVRTAATASIAASVLRKKLDNGLTVLVMPVRGSGVVSVALKIKAGESCAAVEKSAVPDFVGEMLNKGSRRLSKESLADRLEMLGTSIDPDVGNFWVDLSSEVVNEDLSSYLELLSSVVSEPLFESDELNKVKKIKESQLKDAMVETSAVAMNALLGALYKPGCVFYEKPLDKQLSELKTISASDLKDFHSRYFNPTNSCLAVVGDVDPDHAFEAVDAAFKSWHSGESVDITKSACRADEPVKVETIVKQIADKTSVDIALAAPAKVSIKSKDFYAAQIANSALGHDTIASRLAVIREKYGLTYGVQSYFADNVQENAPWVVQLSVNPENTAKALHLVDDIVSGYAKSGITKAELATEKKRLAGEYVVYRMRTPKQLADALTKYELIGVGPAFMDNYASELNKVTEAEVNAAISKYMNINKMVKSLAGSVPLKSDKPAKQ